jgi:DNA-binding IclR family transcriptional regulator
MLGTVVRAGQLLDLFSPDTPEWGATAVARELEIAKSQAHELLMSLSEIGLLRRSQRGRYRLGWRALELGRDVLRSQFSDDVAPLMRRLAQHFGEPVQLVGLDRERPTVIARQLGGSPTDRLIPTVFVGCPDRRCAMTKCLLANRAQYCGDDELRSIKHSGVAFDSGVVTPGLRAVAVPVRDRARETVAALGMWTTAERWPAIGDEMTRALRGTAARIEHSLRTPAGHATELPAAA